MPTYTAPCEPWPIDTTCCDLPEDIDPAVVERWQRVATSILWRLSGMRWGPSCPHTIRPCSRSCLDSSGLVTGPGVVGGRWVPYIDSGGTWRNASICGCTSGCSCGELCELRLDGPVYDIVSVRVDGEEIPPEAYRVDAPNTLVRVDGECWPSCQDMAAPATEPGTAEVVYRTGLPLDEAAIAAVSELTCHYLKGCGAVGGGSCGCRIPKNATRVQRQGVTMEMADPTLIYSEGRTGLPIADAWLAAVNPGRLTSASRVYSPDHPRPRRVGQWP